MSVKTNIPQVRALLSAVEQKSGIPCNTHNAFLELVYQIEKAVRDHLSETTLERLWGYSTRAVDRISTHTLDVLAKYCGEGDWESFCRKIKEDAGIESEEIIGDCLFSSSLKQGDIVKLGWMPDRIILVQYLGNHRFVVTHSENTSIQPGDRFDCLSFQKGREMYLDNYLREGSETPSRYVVGQKNGLTTIEQLG